MRQLYLTVFFLILFLAVLAFLTLALLLFLLVLNLLCLLGKTVHILLVDILLLLLGLVLGELFRLLLGQRGVIDIPQIGLMSPILFEGPGALYVPYAFGMAFLLIITGIPLAVAVCIVIHGDIVG